MGGAPACRYGTGATPGGMPGAMPGGGGGTGGRRPPLTVGDALAEGDAADLVAGGLDSAV